MATEFDLGDGVYASFDGWQIKLQTHDVKKQVIYLEPAVYTELTRFVERLRDHPMAQDEWREVP